ncbi:hypothetical protein Ocin01_18111 [Orchesella cincta]|uniref:Uncharacterized protein n=1 Tax=Orchesella cincta TaxID=48709 RepID=A0A1D2M6H7_ORCCI|nr:hypothetical protein Ocin01_18111 [Orchesella cincta]
MAKLAQLLEEHSPVDKIKSDIPRFLKILWDILKVPPFLKYSNGSNGYMLPLLVEPRRTNEPNYYQHQQVHTLQYLLNCEFSSELSSSGGPGKLFWGGRAKFLTVPYPALIIEVIRTEDVTLSSQSNNQEPVIPNLELDISGFISSSSLHVSDTLSSFHRSCSSITNYQISKESRLVKGLKSAWKVMFQYLEDFTTSTHISPDSIVDASVPTIRRNDDDFTQPRTNSEAADWNTNHQPWYLSPPPSQEGRVSRSSSISSSRKSPYRSLTTTTRTPTPTPQAQVWMELIAVICMTNKKENTCDNHLSVNSNHNRRKFSGYSVYCKAGRDKANPKEFAPWVLYQPQRGVAPQVTLIENCGKWISSLESQAENLALYNVCPWKSADGDRIFTIIYRKNDP